MKKPVFLFLIIAFSMASCDEKIDEFNGFTKAQLEFLLAGDSSNSWERLARWEDDREIEFTDCQKQNHIIFMAAGIDGTQKLLYTYDTETCDSLGFCNEHPGFCMADTANCAADPGFCSSLGADTLFIAFWEVTGVTGDDEITDQVRVRFPGFSNYMKVTQISSLAYAWEFSDMEPGIGPPVVIRETFQRVK